MVLAAIFFKVSKRHISLLSYIAQAEWFITIKIMKQKVTSVLLPIGDGAGLLESLFKAGFSNLISIE